MKRLSLKNGMIIAFSLVVVILIISRAFTLWNLTGQATPSSSSSQANTVSICLPICGDGLVVAPETCDDGNIASGDGCSTTCRLEPSSSAAGASSFSPASASSVVSSQTVSSVTSASSVTFTSASSVISSQTSVSIASVSSQTISSANSASFSSVSSQITSSSAQASSITFSSNSSLNPSSAVNVSSIASQSRSSTSISFVSSPQYGAASSFQFSSVSSQTLASVSSRSLSSVASLTASSASSAQAASVASTRSSLQQFSSVAPAASSSGPFISYSTAVSSYASFSARFGSSTSAVSSTAAPVFCGNGRIDLSEVCDTGTLNGTLSSNCTVTCQLKTIPGCGNGVLDAGEECDDRNLRDLDGCSALCKLELGFCGDGTTQTALNEECDAGSVNGLPASDCDVQCKFAALATCGDGVVDLQTELCDSGANNGNHAAATCRNNCMFQRCGDRITGANEECDDGNNLAGDSCNPDCTRSPNAANPILAGEIFPTANVPPAARTETGPAVIIFLAAGAAAGIGLVRRRLIK